MGCGNSKQVHVGNLYTRGGEKSGEHQGILLVQLYVAATALVRRKLAGGTQEHSEGGTRLDTFW